MQPFMQQTVEALFDPNKVIWSNARPAPGAEPADNELFLGVGARDAALPAHPRMLGWKLPQWRSFALRSTTEVVLRAAEAIDALNFPFTLRAHDATLDTVTAAVLVTYRALHHDWPPALVPIVEYVSEWEQGRTEQAGHYLSALASVFYASMHVFRPENGAPSKEIVTLVAESIDRHLDAAGLAELPKELISSRISRRLKADSDLYRAEISRGWKVQLDLPLDASPGAPFRRIDALFLSSPQDVTVLKLLARPDAESSSYGRGFELMAVHAPNEKNAWGRHTITLAPESPGTLADLALRLDRVEGPNGPDGTPRIKNKPRFNWQPSELEGLADPWYCDGYAWAKGRATLVAPPFVGTRLTREEIWEGIWDRFHLGRNVHVTSSRTVFARPYRVHERRPIESLIEDGWKRSDLSRTQAGLLPSVVASFHGDHHGADITHLERPCAEGTLHLSLYPSDLVLAWIERTGGATTLYELAYAQSKLTTGITFNALPEVRAFDSWLEPVVADRWLVFGAYRINRARSSMLDGSRSVVGLFHAVAAGTAPSLQALPSEAAAEARQVQKAKDFEHWFTSTGGARLELLLEDDATPPPLDQDFALFLLTMGQRYAAFEITRRMGELERKSRTSRWQSLRPNGDVRGDVMFFTNSLWYARVSDDPDLERRYDAWRVLHDMDETVEALKSQTAELDEYRKERFESMVGVLVFVFLPITIVCGFFSGAQFNEMDTRVGWPWTTGGWQIFLAYTAFFTVVVFGTLVAGRLLSWRRR